MGVSPGQPLPYSALLASFLLRIRKNVQCFQLYRGKEHGQLDSQPDARAPMGRACLKVVAAENLPDGSTRPSTISTQVLTTLKSIGIVFMGGANHGTGGTSCQD